MTANAVTVVVFQLVASRIVLRRDPVTAIVIGGMAGFAVIDRIAPEERLGGLLLSTWNGSARQIVAPWN